MVDQLSRQSVVLILQQARNGQRFEPVIDHCIIFLEKKNNKVFGENMELPTIVGGWGAFQSGWLDAKSWLPTPRILIPMSDAQTYHTAIATQLIIITLLKFHDTFHQRNEKSEFKKKLSQNHTKNRQVQSNIFKQSNFFNSVEHRYVLFKINTQICS